jgi:hypothetical protein
MTRLKTAIDAFAQDPTDDHAQNINLAAMSEATPAFLQISDGVTVDPALLVNLKMAQQVLQSTPAPSDLTKHYADTAHLRVQLLQARQDGNSKKVHTLLREALK